MRNLFLWLEKRTCLRLWSFNVSRKMIKWRGISFLSIARSGAKLFFSVIVFKTKTAIYLKFLN